VVELALHLAGLPGGGGTPLASALDATRDLVESLRSAGDTPVVVLLTDGRANIARDGAPGRQRATEDAIAAGTVIHALAEDTNTTTGATKNDGAARPRSGDTQVRCFGGGVSSRGWSSNWSFGDTNASLTGRAEGPASGTTAGISTGAHT
jgi:uncharacterized protein with von Willebrand factor type A (vWA) domain